MRPRDFGAVSIGATAYASLTSAQSATVIGVTSHGLFLLTPVRHILFVSAERFRGPLTINLDRAIDSLRLVEVGAAAQLSNTRLHLPSIKASIVLSVRRVWRSPLPVIPPCSRAQRVQTLQAIAQTALASRGGNGLAALPLRLLDVPGAAAPLSSEQAAQLDRLIEVRRALQAGDDQETIAGLTSLLGWGQGLTPAGDDVVIGWMLMLARGENLPKQVAAPIVAEAYHSTTAISANLIECAADGQGDERLITAVDGIAAGTASVDECVESILGWGSSSGIDALVGMALAVTSS